MTNVRGDKVKTHIISGNTCVNGESANFRGLMFAEVLKNTIKHSAVKAALGSNQSVTSSNLSRSHRVALSTTKVVCKYH